MREKLANKEVVDFDFQGRWLKGEEYLYILANKDAYINAFNLQTYELKCHPESIYLGPESKCSFLSPLSGGLF